MLDRIRRPSTRTAAAVSSHELSIPRTTTAAATSLGLLRTGLGLGTPRGLRRLKYLQGLL